MSIYEIKAFLKNTAAATDGDKVTFTKAWVENFIRGIDRHLEEVMSDKNDLYNRIESLKTDKRCLEEQLKVLEGEKEELLNSREKLKAEMSELNRTNLNLKAQLNEKTNAELRREVERLSDPKNGFVEFVRKVIKEEEDSVTDRIRTRLKDEIDKVFNERVPDMRINDK